MALFAALQNFTHASVRRSELDRLADGFYILTDARNQRIVERRREYDVNRDRFVEGDYLLTVRIRHSDAPLPAGAHRATSTKIGELPARQVIECWVLVVDVDLDKQPPVAKPQQRWIDNDDISAAVRAELRNIPGPTVGFMNERTAAHVFGYFRGWPKVDRPRRYPGRILIGFDFFGLLEWYIDSTLADNELKFEV